MSSSDTKRRAWLDVNPLDWSLVCNSSERLYVWQKSASERHGLRFDCWVADNNIGSAVKIGCVAGVTGGCAASCSCGQPWSVWSNSLKLRLTETGALVGPAWALAGVVWALALRGVWVSTNFPFNHSNWSHHSKRSDFFPNCSAVALSNNLWFGGILSVANSRPFS